MLERRALKGKDGLGPKIRRALAQNTLEVKLLAI